MPGPVIFGENIRCPTIQPFQGLRAARGVAGGVALLPVTVSDKPRMPPDAISMGSFLEGVW